MTKIIECDRCKELVEWKQAKPDPYVMKMFERHTGHTKLYADLCDSCATLLNIWLHVGVEHD